MKRKELEEKNRKARELEEELGINKEGNTSSKKEGRSYRVVDAKDAIEVKPKEYTQEINTKEFNFIQKPSDGTANYATPVRQSKRGLRSKYNLN